MKEESLPELTGENSHKMFKYNEPILLLFASEDDSDSESAVVKGVKDTDMIAFKSNFENAVGKKFATVLGVTKSPAVGIIDLRADDLTKYILQEKITVDSIKIFIEQWKT